MLSTDGRSCGGDVTPHDARAYNLSCLLDDLSRPGLCIVLGAGASYGVTPMSRQEFAAAFRALREANGVDTVLPAHYQEILANPATRFVADLLQAQPTWDADQIINDWWPTMRTTMRFYGQGRSRLTNAESTVLLHEVFTPRDVPTELRRIYRFFECREGVIVVYNYDRIVDESSGFRIIAPHGQRSKLVEDPIAWARARQAAYDFGVAVPVDFHLPVPEAEMTGNPDYDQAVLAWRAARCIVLIGYAFGWGADEFSFADFGANVASMTPVHVICPNPDNRDLVKQVAYGLKGRGPDGRVTGHPFRWRPLAASILETLDDHRASRVLFAAGHAAEIAARHDRT